MRRDHDFPQPAERGKRAERRGDQSGERHEGARRGFKSGIPGEPSLRPFDALESRPDFHVLAEKTLQRYRRKPIFRPNGESRWFGRGAMDAGSTGLPSRSTSCSTESCRGADCEQLQRLEVTLDQCWDLLLPAPGPPGGRPRPRPAGVGDEGTVCRRLHRLTELTQQGGLSRIGILDREYGTEQRGAVRARSRCSRWLE